MDRLFITFLRSPFNPEEKERLRQKVGDRDQLKRTFDALIAEGEALMALGDPTSPGARDLARRWAAMDEQIAFVRDPASKRQGSSGMERRHGRPRRGRR